MLLGLICVSGMAQKKSYAVTSGEIIFGANQTAFTRQFLAQYPGASLVGSNVRFTLFFHLGEYFHHDLSNNFGLYSGLAIRNIGMITDETLPQTVPLLPNLPVNYTNYNVIRRQYTLGVPLALKLGSFKDHFYAFVGGEYELAFAFKEKYWSDSFDRSGKKTKRTTWFSEQTPTFLPSAFGGVQFPGGFNLKFTYYLTDFLHNNYAFPNNNQPGSNFNISDQTRYEKSQLLMFSLSWQMKTNGVKKQASTTKDTSL